MKKIEKIAYDWLEADRYKTFALTEAYEAGFMAAREMAVELSHSEGWESCEAPGPIQRLREMGEEEV